MNRTVQTSNESKTSQTVQTSRNGSDLKPETWSSTLSLRSSKNLKPGTWNLEPSAGTLYLTVISAPSAEVREEVARHLQFWPYVKFFKYQGDRHLLCCFCLGEAKDGYQLKQLYERSRQLVLLCLRQYDVTITRWKALPSDFRLFHNNKLFTRPEASVRPFISFMGDSGSVPHPASLSSGRHVVPQNLSKIYKKISQCILSIF